MNRQYGIVPKSIFVRRIAMSRWKNDCPTQAKARTVAGSRGFTAIETIVVVSIAVIVTAMAVPQGVTILNAYKLQSAVSAVTGAIQATRMQAVGNTTPYKIVFTKSSNSYQISSCNGCSILSPTGNTYTNINTSIPFATDSRVVLSADTTLYLRPGGAVQLTEGTSACPTVTSFTLTYKGTTKTIAVGCYGQITVT